MHMRIGEARNHEPPLEIDHPRRRPDQWRGARIVAYINYVGSPRRHRLRRRFSRVPGPDVAIPHYQRGRRLSARRSHQSKEQEYKHAVA